MSRLSIEPATFTGASLDRSEDVRRPEQVAAGWPTARVLAVDPRGRLATVRKRASTDAAGTGTGGPAATGTDTTATATTGPATTGPATTSTDTTSTDTTATAESDPELAWRGSGPWGATPPLGAMLLGRLDGIDHWAVTTAAEPPHAGRDVRAAAPADRAVYPGPPRDGAVPHASLRTLAPLLDADQAALAATAVALARWHGAAGFCARCGRPTVPDATGHSRACTAGHQDFPRTDPAVIVLVHDGADRAVLARQPSWAPGRFSVLAGFVEAGEALEDTVAREIGEEIDVEVDHIEYLGSQPWPLPRSLMIGFAARAPAGAALRPRAGEIDEARWFTRDEIVRLLEGGGWDHENPSAAITLPGPVSIARRMVEGFVRSG
jgi:NAD+ diphosphatase